MEILILFLVGLTFGSFLNVLIYRFSKKEKIKEILKGRSFCPNCKETIKWYDNIPLISYLVLKGKCRHCGWSIPLRYPIVEILGGLTPVGVYLLFKDDGWLTVAAYTLMLYLLIVVSFVDWETFEVPDLLSVGGTLVGFLLSFSRTDITPLESLLAALIGVLLVVALIFLYYKLKGIVPLGFGDAKILALIGAFEGFTGIYCAIFVGSILGLLYFLPQIVKSRSMQFAVPFVPFLALGAAVGLVCRALGFNLLFP